MRVRVSQASVVMNGALHSTVTDLARFLGQSTWNQMEGIVYYLGEMTCDDPNKNKLKSVSQKCGGKSSDPLNTRTWRKAMRATELSSCKRLHLFPTGRVTHLGAGYSISKAFIYTLNIRYLLCWLCRISRCERSKYTKTRTRFNQEAVSKMW